jgi:hypothetical protein
MNAPIQRLSTVLILLLTAATLVARDYTTRASARTAVNQNTNINRNTNVNVNRNINVSQNVNVNRNVNVNVGGYNTGCCYHPVATAMAVTAAAVTTAAVIGSIVHSLPPACSAVSLNGVTFQQCGSTWYQPQFMNGATTYVVVNAPR